MVKRFLNDFLIMRHLRSTGNRTITIGLRADKSQFSSEASVAVHFFYLVEHSRSDYRVNSGGVTLNFARIHSFPEALWKYCPPAERTAGFHGR